MSKKSLLESQEKKARSDAIRNFANHVIKPAENNAVLYCSWHCRNKSGSSNLAFTITTIPGSLIVTGDIGNLIVNRSDNMISWCKRAVHSTQYFAEKYQVVSRQ